EEGEVASSRNGKIKTPHRLQGSYQATKGSKPPPFTGGFVPNKPIRNKVYSFDLTKVDALFDEMLLQKAIETPHRMPKPKSSKARRYCGWHNSWNHSTNGENPNCSAKSGEDWIEENEEEQLDYEPSTDDQNALLGME
ncbi:unnamed protein product, partial [Prunus brigantina]